MTEHGGHLLGSPLGFSTKNSPPIAIKAPGLHAPTTLVAPDFSRLVQDVFGTDKPPNPILALSMGLDRIHIPALDQLGPTDIVAEVDMVVPAGGWIAIEYAVDHATFNRHDTDQSGSLVHANISAVADGEIHTTVFNCLVPGSHVVAQPEGFAPVVDLTPYDLGIVNTPQPDAILGLDLHLALYDSRITNANSFFAGQLPSPDSGSVTVYFTVDETVAAAAVLLTADPGDCIFATSWDQELGRWRPAALYKRLPDGVSGPITGLSLDTTDLQADRHRLMLVLRASSIDEKVKATRAGTGTTMHPLRNVAVSHPPGSKTRLARFLGVGRGLGDLCTADPLFDPLSSTVVYVPPHAYQPHVDDFAIARRLDGPAELTTGTELRASGFLMGKHTFLGRILGPRGLTSQSFKRWPGIIRRLIALLIRPRLYMRSLVNDAALRVGDEVTVTWFLVTGFPSATHPPPAAPTFGNWQYHARQTLTWNGQPLVADVRIPDIPGDSTRAMAATWRSGTRASPAIVLRLQEP